MASKGMMESARDGAGGREQLQEDCTAHPGVPEQHGCAGTCGECGLLG